MNNRCPLCHSALLQQIEMLSVDDISMLYAQRLHMDVKEEFGDVSTVEFLQCLACDLRFFSPLCPGSANFYDRLQKFPWYYLAAKPEHQFALDAVQHAERVLEVGCGSGVFGANLQGQSYVGLELSPRAIAAAREKGLTVLNEEVEEHSKTHSETYDAVCAFQVLEHVADIQGFVRACIACLRPGGILLVSVPSADSFVARVSNNPTNLPPHHMSWWTDACLRQIGSLFSLGVVEIRHEPLEEIHRRWYATHLLVEALRTRFGFSFQLVDSSRRYAAIRRAAAACDFLIRPALATSAFAPYGHSVTALYRKSNGMA